MERAFGLWSDFVYVTPELLRDPAVLADVLNDARFVAEDDKERTVWKWTISASDQRTDCDGVVIRRFGLVAN